MYDNLRTGTFVALVFGVGVIISVTFQFGFDSLSSLSSKSHTKSHTTHSSVVLVSSNATDWAWTATATPTDWASTGTNWNWNGTDWVSDK